MKVRLTSSQKIKVSDSADIYAIMRDVLLRERKIDRSKEHFWIVCLAHNNKLLLIELISFGSATRTVVEPTEVFSFALQKKASQLIMVHNHPSGDTKASFKDKEITERMAAIGTFVKVPVIDHLIITDEHYFSFADSGLLQKIVDESHYDLSFSQIDRLKHQMHTHELWAKKKLERMGKEAGRREEKLKESLKQKDESLKLKEQKWKKEVEKLKKLLANKKRGK